MELAHRKRLLATGGGAVSVIMMVMMLCDAGGHHEEQTYRGGYGEPGAGERVCNRALQKVVGEVRDLGHSIF